LYADDIILLAPLVSALEKLLTVCEKELTWMDMAINMEKSIVDVTVGRLTHGSASQYLTRGPLRWHDCLVITGIVS